MEYLYPEEEKCLREVVKEREKKTIKPVEKYTKVQIEEASRHIELHNMIVWNAACEEYEQMLNINRKGD